LPGFPQAGKAARQFARAGTEAWRRSAEFLPSTGEILRY